MNDNEFAKILGYQVDPDAWLQEVNEQEPEVVTEQKVGHEMMTNLVKGKTSGFLYEWLKAYDACTEAPAELIVAGGLSVLAATIGKSVQIPYGTQSLNCNLQIALIAPSGAKKSTVMNTARYYLTRPGSESVVVGDDFTVEALVQQIEHNPNIFLISDEIARLQSLNNKSYGAGTSEFITSAYGGWISTAMRKQHLKDGEQPEPAEIIEVCLNILGGSTEEWLNSMSIRDVKSGELARWVFVFADYADKRYAIPKSPTKEQVAYLHSYIEKARVNLYGNVRMTQDAIDLFTKDYNAWQDSIDEYDRRNHFLGEILRPIGARLYPLALKVATILEVSDDNTKREPVITKDNMQRALQLIEGLQNVYIDKLNSGLFMGAEKSAEHIILNYLRTNSRVTFIELRDRADLDSRGIEQVLKNMIRSGLVTTEEEGEVIYYKPGVLA